jgi:hypothetical protein
VPVAHAYNPSYTGGRDQEDRGSKPDWANSSWDPILKKIHHKNRAGGVAQGVGWVQALVLQTTTKKRRGEAGGAGRVAQGLSPQFMPQYKKKKKNCKI